MFYAIGNAGLILTISSRSPCCCFITTYRDDRKLSALVSGDTASSCNSPALDGLILYKHVDSSCGLANRTYHVALPAEEVVASMDAGLCLQRGSAVQSRQQLFDNLPAGVMGVRACCQQDAAFIYFYADQSCTEFGLPPEPPETDPRRGLRFSLNNGMVHTCVPGLCMLV